MWPTILVIGALVAAVVGFVFPWQRRQQALNRLLARQALDDNAVYSAFYESAGLPKDKVLEIWHEIAETLRVPADRLRPADQFGTDIGVYWILSDDLDVLASKGRDRAKHDGLAVDLQDIRTVDNYIRCFAAATPAQSKTPGT
jgi:hypothetical protein